MPNALRALPILRALAILLAVSALTGWVVYSAIYAQRGESRTRAPGTKSQTSPEVIRKWLQTVRATLPDTLQTTDNCPQD